MVLVVLQPGQRGLGQQFGRGRSQIEGEAAEERLVILHMPREKLTRVPPGRLIHTLRRGIHTLGDGGVGMLAQPLLAVVLKEIGARTEDQGHAVASGEIDAGPGHGDVPRVFRACAFITNSDCPVGMHHEQLGFVFETVAHFPTELSRFPSRRDPASCMSVSCTRPLSAPGLSAVRCITMTPSG